MKLETPQCPMCGDDMTMSYRRSTGMDIEPTGLRATCMRCGYEMKIPSLIEMRDEEAKMSNFNHPAD